MFKYTITFWDDYDKISKKESGIVNGVIDNYSDAVKALETYYGNNLSIINYLEYYDIGNMTVLTDEVLAEAGYKPVRANQSAELT